MRREHFEALRPVCPLCRLRHSADRSLVLGDVAVETAAGIRQGLVRCESPDCLMEYPVIDGIPILIASLRTFLTDNLTHLTSRTDLSPLVESLIGDAVGPGTSFDATRQHLSIYGWDHYGDLAASPAPDDHGPRPGGVVRCLDRGLELLAEAPGSPAIDLGCAVGRSAFELAARTDGPVLGVDTNLAMLRVAQQVLDTGTARYPRRRVGLVYERQEHAAHFPGADRVDFWACDATALPFRDGTFRFAGALQLLDCTPSPHELLVQLRRVLAPGAPAILATPYDWSPSATPVEAWIGGHSQRAPRRGASEPLLRALLTPGAHAQSIEGLAIVHEVDDLPWSVRLHDRSTMHYSSHLLVVRAHG